MQLVNASEVMCLWLELCENPLLRLILLRHAEKPKDGSARCGCSPRGKTQLTLFARAIEGAIVGLIMRGGVQFLSSGTDRNRETLEAIIPEGLRWGNPVQFPPKLDIPNFGPNEEDLATAQSLADELAISRKEAAFQLERHGKPRLGEHPDAIFRRIHLGYVMALQSAGDDVVLYSGNTPGMNEAIGITGAMEDLEALFVAWEDRNFVLLGRIKPEFAD